jgi:hypothetical protein
MEISELERVWKETVVGLIYGTILALSGGADENREYSVRIDGASVKIRTGQFDDTYQKFCGVSRFTLRDIQELNMPLKAVP